MNTDEKKGFSLAEVTEMGFKGELENIIKKFLVKSDDTDSFQNLLAVINDTNLISREVMFIVAKFQRTNKTKPFLYKELGKLNQKLVEFLDSLQNDIDMESNELCEDNIELDENTSDSDVESDELCEDNIELDENTSDSDVESDELCEDNIELDENKPFNFNDKKSYKQDEKNPIIITTNDNRKIVVPRIQKEQWNPFRNKSFGFYLMQYMGDGVSRTIEEIKLHLSTKCDYELKDPTWHKFVADLKKGKANDDTHTIDLVVEKDLKAKIKKFKLVIAENGVVINDKSNPIVITSQSGVHETSEDLCDVKEIVNCHNFQNTCGKSCVKHESDSDVNVSNVIPFSLMQLTEGKYTIESNNEKYIIVVIKV